MSEIEAIQSRVALNLVSIDRLDLVWLYAQIIKGLLLRAVPKNNHQLGKADAEVFALMKAKCFSHCVAPEITLKIYR